MKQIITLVLIFLGLLGTYFIIREYADPKEFTPPKALSLEGWGRERFQSIVLGEGEEQVTLQQQPDTTWQVNGFNADKDVLLVFLETLGNSEVVSRVSTNQENHSRFEVDDASGLIMTVDLTDGKQDTMILGKSAGGNSVYVRLPNDNAVYVLDGPGRQLFRQDASLWRERNIIQQAAHEIELVSFDKKRLLYSVELTDGTWQLKRPASNPVDLNAPLVGEWIKKIVGIQAGEYPTAEEIAAVQDRQADQDIELRTNFEELTWFVYETEKEGFYLVIRDKDQAGFFVSKSLIDELFLSYNELRNELDGE